MYPFESRCEASALTASTFGYGSGGELDREDLSFPECPIPSLVESQRPWSNK